MAIIHQTIETQKSAAEMRHLIDSRVLCRPELRLILDETRWDGNVLHAQGKMGHGTITVEERRVVIHIELSLFGSVAKGAIESTLAEQIKRLGS